jgi:regulator of cell morphogenesis and NO signaling
MTTQSVTQYYGDDHDRLDGLFQQYQQHAVDDPTHARDCFRQFKMGLQRHIVWEENILFPLFEQHAGLHGCGPTEVMRTEHREIKRVLEELHGKVQQGDSNTATEAQELLSILGQHNDKEERILYPAIDQQLSIAEQQDVFVRMAQVTEADCGSCCAEPSQATGEDA